MAAPLVSFAELSNVGIIQGIWFSEEPFYAGDEVRVYTAVQNNSGDDVEGEIEFFYNGDSVGTKPFSALDSRITESWIDIVAVSGKHDFVVEIKEISKDAPEDGAGPVDPILYSYEKEAIVYIDSDGDDVPDHEDDDDDNDGYDDHTEEKEGTDPLNATDYPIPDDSSSDSSSSSNGNTTTFLTSEISAEEKVELQERVPEVLDRVMETSPLVENIALQISRLQKAAEIGVEKGKEKSLEKQSSSLGDLGEFENDNADLQTQIESALTSEAVSRAKTDFWDILKKIVSTWWVFPILIFVTIGLLLKLIFKIFGRKFRR